MRTTGSYLLFVVAIASLTACTETPPNVVGDAGVDSAVDGGPVYRPECENINPQDCLLPWPSSRYLVDDPTTRTGRRMQIPIDAMPHAKRGRVPVNPELFERFDGFSPATSMITSFGDVDIANLADERHIPDSLLDGSPTVLIDAATNARVAHFAEVDTWADVDPARRPFYVRPATRLQEGHRYIVAIRELTLRGGGAVQPSEYFAALRDGTTPADPSDIEERRAHFEDVFTHLEAAGVARTNLIEAWDFEISSGESIWGDLVTMRDEALRRVEADAMPRCTVTMVEDLPNGTSEDAMWRRVNGTVRVPLFLNGTDAMDYESSRIHRAADGTPTPNGFADVPWVANIPVSLHDRIAAGGEPGRLLDYGHGLFGDRFETDSGWFRHVLSETEMVSIAIDWWGMSGEDVARVALTLQEFSNFASTTERLGQGLVNHVVLERSFLGACAELPELQIPLTAGGTAPSIDTTRAYYYGNSQGGIMGLALAGIAVDADRFVLGVGGMSYSIMIPRSVNWQLYGGIMRNGYEDTLQRAMIMQMAQSQWDLGEPSTFAPHTLTDPLPCATDICPSGLTPVKRLLLQIGRDDAQVPNISAEIAARTIGLSYVTPSPIEPYDMPSLTAAMGEPLGDSALVFFDIPGVPVLPLGTRDPGENNDAHEGVRRSPAGIEQLDLFLRPDGVVVQTCDGICDPN